jgi:hypothetical protein
MSEDSPPERILPDSRTASPLPAIAHYEVLEATQLIGKGIGATKT